MQMVKKTKNTYEPRCGCRHQINIFSNWGIDGNGTEFLLSRGVGKSLF